MSFSNTQTVFVANVINYEQNPKGVVFYVLIRNLTSKQSWTFGATYNDFRRLHTKLQMDSMVKQEEIPPFPMKSLNKTEKFLRQRQQELEMYINEVFDNKSTKNSQTLAKFIFDSKPENISNGLLCDDLFEKNKKSFEGENNSDEEENQVKESPNRSVEEETDMKKSFGSDKSSKSTEKPLEKTPEPGLTAKIKRIFSGDKLNTPASSQEKKSTEGSSTRNSGKNSERNSAENSERSSSRSSLERNLPPLDEEPISKSDKKFKKHSKKHGVADSQEMSQKPVYSEPLKYTNIAEEKSQKAGEKQSKEKSFFENKEYIFENPDVNRSSLDESNSHINDESLLRYKDMKFTVLTKAEKEDYWKKFDVEEFDFNIKPKKKNKFLSYFCGDFCE